jgi:hypothetical protein
MGSWLIFGISALDGLFANNDEVCPREAPINSCSCDVFVLARILTSRFADPITVHFATRDDRVMGACGIKDKGRPKG